LTVGKHRITFSGKFAGEEPPQVEFTVKSLDNPENIFAEQK
jgi:hypothetical protein